MIMIMSMKSKDMLKNKKICDEALIKERTKDDIPMKNILTLNLHWHQPINQKYNCLITLCS